MLQFYVHEKHLVTANFTCLQIYFCSQQKKKYEGNTQKEKEKLYEKSPQ